MLADRVAAFLREVGERHLVLARAVQDQVLDRVVQHFPRRLDVELVVLGQRPEHGKVEPVAPVPALDRARGETHVRVRDHALGIEEVDRAQAVAGRARAHGVVEREETRLKFGQRVAAHRAGEARREEVLLAAVHLHGERAAVGMAQGRLEGFGEPLLHVRAHLDAVDHHVDGVLHVARELGRRVEFVHLAVDPHARESLRAQVVEEVVLFALAAGNHRRDDHQASVLGQREHVVDHLRHRLGAQRLLVVRAEGRADPRVQQAQVVVDFGHRAHGRARVVAGGLLLDADRRAQALDHVDIGLVHQLQELPRIGRQALDIAALALRIQRVESQAGLARTRQPSDHDQRVLGDVEVDVLQVVRARAADLQMGRASGQRPRVVRPGPRLGLRGCERRGQRFAREFRIRHGRHSARATGHHSGPVQRHRRQRSREIPCRQATPQPAPRRFGTDQFAQAALQARR